MVLVKRYAIILCVLLIFVCAPSSTAAQIRVHPPRTRASLALVPNYLSSDVSILDLRNSQELARVSLLSKPILVSMDPRGRFAYVLTDRNSSSGLAHLYRIDLYLQSVSGKIDLTPTGVFSDMEISPRGNELALVDNFRSTISFVDLRSFSVSASQVLCQLCGTGSFSLFSSATISFHPAGTDLSIAVPVDAILYTLDVPSHSLVNQQAMSSQPGGLVLYSDLVRFPLIPQLLFSLQTFSQPRVFDTAQNISLDFPVTNPQLANDMAHFQIGSEYFLALGDGANDLSFDFVHLAHINSGSVLPISASESASHLLFHPNNLEVWTLCFSNLGCSPAQVDVYSLLSLSKTHSIPIGTALQGIPSFSPDGDKYVFPVSGSGQVGIIDINSKNLLPPIPVGQGPKGVFVEGDSRNREAY